MYKIGGIVFCVALGVLVAIYGWIALLWTPIGFIVGLFLAANTIFLLILGLPLAYHQVKEYIMLPKVYSRILRTPLIWLIQITVIIVILYFLWPSAIDWILNNKPLVFGFLFGFVAILISPLSKRCRQDFRVDFDKSYGRFYIDSMYITDKTDYRSEKKQKKQVEAAVKIFSNLYLHTTSTSSGVLHFKFPDSKFRYMIFCMCAMVKACEDIIHDPELLIKDCIQFLASFTTHKSNVQDYFDVPIDPEEAENKGTLYSRNYLENWSKFYEAIKGDNAKEGNSIICSMIYSTETNEPLTKADKERLDELSWVIASFIPSMQNAFIDSIGKYR